MLSTRIRRADELTESDIACMYALYSAYYDEVSEAAFVRDLRCKQYVIQLLSEQHLRGFSTIALMNDSVEGQPVRAIFSGDTIIHHDAWGEQSLATAFCEFAGRTCAVNPTVPLYWFLISKGHRTYRYLRSFAKKYYPHHSLHTPPEIQATLNALASQRFGSNYDPLTGLVTFSQPAGRLKPEWDGMRAHLTARPEVRFFVERNPGYFRGDELACITELSSANLRSFALRGFKRTRCGERDLKNAA